MTNVALWGDYSSGRIGGADLAAHGIVGVIRYVGLGSAGKRITAAEYRDLTAHGIQVLLVVELGIHDAEGGYAAGQANARAALADARALGIPDSVGIAVAGDEHLTAAQVRTALDYVRGAISVLGPERTGVYGFAELVDAAHAAGLGGWWWKCGSAPTTSEANWVTFWQRNSGQTTVTINKVVVDYDEERHVVRVAPGQEEDDMDMTTPVPTPETAVPGTAGAALAGLLFGAAGQRSAGQLALAVYNVETKLDALTAAVATMATAATGVQVTKDEVLAAIEKATTAVETGQGATISIPPAATAPASPGAPATA